MPSPFSAANFAEASYSFMTQLGARVEQSCDWLVQYSIYTVSFYFLTLVLLLHVY